MSVKGLDILLPCVMEEMVYSSHIFHLTGSRYFRHAESLSDYDFFTQDSPEVRAWLLGQGFGPVSSDFKAYPDDPNIAEVWEKGAVQIQLVRDVNGKIKAQNILCSLPSIPWAGETDKYLRKHMARKWWQWAFGQVQK